MTDYRSVGRVNRNWGRWGIEDRLGTLNHLTDQRLVQASRLVRKGKIFDLSPSLSADGPAPGRGGRTNPIHFMSITPGDVHITNHMITPSNVAIVDDWITMPLQCATQWDGLCHVGYDDFLQ